jgi:hypothetical protein
LVEFHGPWSVGYNGTDSFSPEMDYCVDPTDIGPDLRRINALLANKGRAPLTASQLSGQVNQLKAFEEYHADGLRFDEVRVIQWNGGRPFCQQLTETLRWLNPEAVLIAAYWEEPRAAALWSPPAGLGFDVEYADLLRDRVREVVSQASGGPSAAVEVGRLRDALQRPWGVPRLADP